MTSACILHVNFVLLLWPRLPSVKSFVALCSACILPATDATRVRQMWQLIVVENRNKTNIRVNSLANKNMHLPFHYKDRFDP